MVQFLDYLGVMARFPRLSVANTLLVFEQMPDATRLGDFEHWKRGNASVKKGQNAVLILEPGDEYTRDDGSIAVSFNVRKVFDERQTTARHIEPRYPSTQDALHALVHNSPVGIKVVEGFDNPLTSASYDHETRSISVKHGLEPHELFKALAKELAHAGLAKQDTVYDCAANKEAACIASYVVARRYGIDTADLDVTYTPPRSQDGSLQLTREDMGRIRSAAKTISERMDINLESSRNKDTQPKQQAAYRGGRDER